MRVTLGSPFWWLALVAYLLRRDAKSFHVGDLGFVLALGTFLSGVVLDSPGKAGSGVLLGFPLFATVLFVLMLPLRRPLSRLKGDGVLVALVAALLLSTVAGIVGSRPLHEVAIG